MLYQFDWLEDVMLPVTITVAGSADPQFLLAMQAENIEVNISQSTGPAPWPWFPAEAVLYGLAKAGTQPHIWFVGEPTGQEERSWRDLVLAIGRQQRILTPMAESAVDEVNRPVRVAVFTTPSCPKCAQAVRIIGAMALRNPNITMYAINLASAQELLLQWDFQALPAFVVNDEFMVITVNEWILAQKISQARLIATD
jgi:alkyl hydroperoxide reductase subunit AhpF